MRPVARATLLVGASLAVGAWSSTTSGAEADARLFGAVNRGHGPGADRAFTAITELGSLWASGAAAAMLFLAGERRAAVRGAVAAGVTWLAGQGLKRAADRPRPYHADPGSTRLLIEPPHATSWPSSHPAVLDAFTTAASRSLGAGRATRAGLTALSGAVAVSRTYLGVHYPSDVASGLLLGRAVGLAISVFRGRR